MGWTDRRGQARSLVVRGAVAALDPTWSAALGLPPAGARSGDRMGRSAWLPLELVALAEGRGAWVPYGATSGYYVVELASARVLARCTGSAPLAGAAGCADNMEARLLGGHVAFHAPGRASIEGARSPSGVARRLSGVHIATQTQGGATPPVQCFDDSAQAAGLGRSHVAYACVVTLVDGNADPDTPRAWSGRATVLADASWTIGNGPGQSKVCRYSALSEGLFADNSAHPMDYANVAVTLMNQNFLVIDATASLGGQVLDNACPSEPGPVMSGQTDASTLAHQPVGIP